MRRMEVRGSTKEGRVVNQCGTAMLYLWPGMMEEWKMSKAVRGSMRGE